MTRNTFRILLVDDDEDDYVITSELLADIPGASYTLEWVATYETALAALEDQEHDVYLLDYRLGEHTGLELLHTMMNQGCQAPMILLTGKGDREVDLAAMKAGVADYLIKGQMDAPLLERAIRYALERKQAEAEIRRLNEDLERRVADRTTQLEAANRELEAFSYSVSHDLRAPLRAVNGFAQILLQEFAPQLPPEARNYLHLVRDNATRMGQLIADLLDFSRLSRQPLNKQPVAPADLVRQVLAELHDEQRGREVTIAIAELPLCQADPTLLKQVFVNLLANALKFTRHREQAVIEVGSQPGAAGPLIYYVKDNGAGFEMKYVEKLFQVFQRLHRAEDYEGTGVGLAIVQRILHRHGGRIWAEAALNQGAAFYFTLEEGPSCEGSSGHFSPHV